VAIALDPRCEGFALVTCFLFCFVLFFSTKTIQKFNSDNHNQVFLTVGANLPKFKKIKTPCTNATSLEGAPVF